MRPLALALVLFAAAPQVVVADPLVLKTVAEEATVAPELARFNDLLSHLAETLKPALVQVRVGRAPSSDKSDETRRGTGSGFLVTEDGYLVTNAHVVESAETVQIRLADGKRFVGRVVGKDSRVDLALVKIDNASSVPVLPLGDSNRLRVGEFVLALGHPFGLEQTVSFGIVSRKGAPLTVAAPGFDFIQTDAAINPGNSGGPLINMAGEVVGVNSMAARNGSIGFAIPSNLVKLLLPRLAEKGRIEWGWLGISIGEVGDDEVEKFKLPDTRGVVIRDVVPGQPAAEGGLKPNDVVVSVEGTLMEGPQDLQRMVATTPIGSRLKLNVIREGKTEALEVTVGLYRESPLDR
jgi:serine protease Do